jgi:hypothetical protein
MANAGRKTQETGRKKTQMAPPRMLKAAKAKSLPDVERSLGQRENNR